MLRAPTRASEPSTRAVLARAHRARRGASSGTRSTRPGRARCEQWPGRSDARGAIVDEAALSAVLERSSSPVGARRDGVCAAARARRPRDMLHAERTTAAPSREPRVAGARRLSVPAGSGVARWGRDGRKREAIWAARHRPRAALAVPARALSTWPRAEARSVHRDGASNAPRRCSRGRR